LLVVQNGINTVEPQLVNAAAGDFRPLSGGNVDQLTVYAIPNFGWSELPTVSAVPVGGVDNSVSKNYLGESRSLINRLGAY
jgi:hypothetical protein